MRSRSSGPAGGALLVEEGLLPGHVLQRRPGGARALLRGACRDRGPVTATIRRADGTALPGWSGRRVGGAKGGRFGARLAGLPTGGPYAVTIRCGGEAAEIPDVFVGDLWLMAGQSNMEGCGFLDAAPEPHPQVRCFTMARRWEKAREPLHIKAESPDAAHEGQSLSLAASARLRRTMRKGCSLGLFFGKLLQGRTGVPQGLIATAHGGTSMAQWSPRLAGRGGGSLYGSMRLSLQAVGQPVAGVLWYQGESEALPELAKAYTPAMRRLVAAVRDDLGQPSVPWLMVQIGRFIHDSRDPARWPDPASWNSVQEQQRLLPRSVRRCVVVPAVDLELDDLAHLGGDSHAVLARRLADMASRLVHRDRSFPLPVAPRSLRFRDPGHPFSPRIEVAFSLVVGGLRSAGPVRGFTLVDGKGQPVSGIHRAAVEGNRVTLYLTRVSMRGLRLRYGHGFDPLCTLVDGRGMAVPAFGPLPVAGIPSRGA